MRTSLSPSNFIGVILALCVLLLVCAYSLERAQAQSTHTPVVHTCVAPCIVKFAPGTQEDEVAWDFVGSSSTRSGPRVHVTRACDHYCFEAITQSGRNYCRDFKILPVLTDKGDTWRGKCLRAVS